MGVRTSIEGMIVWILIGIGEENGREVAMDMREMVDKVKKGEPLYGHSSLTPYMQGVAARNSRYSALMAQVIPWPNFVNHNQVRTEFCKDTWTWNG